MGNSLHRERQTARAAIQSHAELLRQLVQQAQLQAEQQAQVLVSTARQQMEQEFDAELERLERLAVEEEERLQLLVQRSALEKHLDQASLRLDALRLIVRA